MMERLLLRVPSCLVICCSSDGLIWLRECCTLVMSDAWSCFLVPPAPDATSATRRLPRRS